MPQVESYLTVEENLQRQGRAAFRSTMSDVAALIESLAVQRRWSEAEKATQLLSFEPGVEQIRSRLDSHYLQAMLLGAGLFHGSAAAADFVQEGRIPEEVELAVAQFVSVMTDSTLALQRAVMHTLASLQEREKAELEEDVSDGDVPFETIHKVSTSELADMINASVMGTGEGLFDIGANLTTSRLTSLGFLDQASKANIATFQITEILDERICPVCRGFHGKQFRVNTARSRLLRQLQLTGEELKAQAPFPGQSRNALKRLAKMSRKAFQQQGWDTPPFHPRCRGVLVPVGTVPEGEILGFRRFGRSDS
jgi:hypothetical protein